MSFLKKNKNNTSDSELKEDFEFGKRVENIDRKPDVLTPEEVLNLGNSIQETPNNALASLRKKLTKTEDKAEDSETPKTKETVNLEPEKAELDSAETIESESPLPQKTSLLDRCSPYFVDNEGKDITVNEKPFYKLQSVADILEADTKDRIKRLSEQYGIDFDEISIPPITSNEIEITESPELPLEEPKVEEKEPPSETADGDTKPFRIISDIDGSTGSFPKITPKVPTQTITFTPINSGNTKSEITVTTKTQQIDLTGEFTSLPDEIPASNDSSVKLQENDFDEYIPQTEVTDRKSASKLIRKFSISKRNHFLASTFSILFTLIICIAKLPFLSEAILKNTSVFMTVCTVLSGITVLLNADMFINLAKLFKKSSGPDCAASLASITTLCYAVFGILKGEIITESDIAFKRPGRGLSPAQIGDVIGKTAGCDIAKDTFITFEMLKE